MFNDVRKLFLVSIAGYQKGKCAVLFSRGCSTSFNLGGLATTAWDDAWILKHITAQEQFGGILADLEERAKAGRCR